MINETVLNEQVHCLHTCKRISWSAIVTGALVALGLGFLLNLFGLAIGLSAFTLSDTGASIVAIGGLLGILIGIIASMLAAGYTAGYLGRLYCPKHNLGIIYGFSTWTLALILTALITAPLTHHVANYTKITSPSVATVANKPVNTSNTASTSATVSTPTLQNTNQKTIKITASAETLAGSVFCVFILFFVGALSCCFGACWGMGCRRDD